MNQLFAIQTNLAEVRIDEDYGYGFLDETKKQKEEFIEQFSSLNSTCFVRSTKEIKGRSQKSSENGMLRFFFVFLVFFLRCD